MDTEQYFPRGNLDGIKEKPSANQTQNDSLIIDTLKRKRSDSESNVNFKKSTNKKLHSHVHVVDLNYETIENGMTLLACIRSMTTFTLEVELPGKMCGKMKITSVSDPFTKLIQQEVNNHDSDDKHSPQFDKIFKIGQFLPVTVMEKSCSNTGTKLILSTNPKDIQQNWSNERFKKGCLIWAAVDAESDHGYQLCVGNEKFRIFLPFKNVRDGIKYVVGQPLWCVIMKSTTVSDISTVIVSTLEKHVNNTNEDIDLLNLIPGAQVNFTVEYAVKFGVVGKFQTYTGCINEAFLKVPYEDVRKYKEGDNFKAFFLYLHPVSNLAYFSIRGLCSTVPKFSNGTVLNSEVVKTINRGLQISLPNASTGLIAFKRIPETKNYPPGSQHNCQILDYRRLEQLYICTFETKTVAEKKSNDVSIGQLVEVEVINIVNEGVVVQLDKISGFIRNFHLSDGPYDESVKEKFYVGQTLKAKIWNINERGVHLTCKSFLLNSDICFTLLQDEGMVGKQYPGVVAKKCLKGILVVFYGDVRGMLLNSYIQEVFGADSYDGFYEGEVIVPIIDKIQRDFLLLKLNVPDVPTISTRLKIGDCISGVITKITPNGLNVSVHSNVHGFVPVAHLSSSLSLTPLLLKTYKVRDSINDLLCISTTGTPILSKREFKEYKIKNLTIPRLIDLAVGSIIRCSYLTTEDTRVRVSTPLLPKAEVLNLYSNDLDNGPDDTFINQQAIVAKVTKLNHDRKLVKITARSKEVFDWTGDGALNDLEQYLQDLKRIETQIPHISQYHLGQRVNCTVTQVNKTNCSVVLKNDVAGVVRKKHCPENIKIGSTVKGVVLWTNLKDNCLIVSLKEDIIDRVSSKQNCDVELNTSVRARILSSEDDVVIGVMENKQLIFLPNLFSKRFLRLSQYKVLQEVNVTVRRKVQEKIICVDTFIVSKLKKAREATLSKKNKLIKTLPINNKTGNSYTSTDTLKQVEQDNSSEDENATSTRNKRAKKLPTIMKTANAFSASEHVKEESKSSSEDESTTVNNSRSLDETTSKKNKRAKKLPTINKTENAFPETKPVKAEEKTSSEDESATVDNSRSLDRSSKKNKRTKKLPTISSTKNALPAEEKQVKEEEKNSSEDESTTLSRKNKRTKKLPTTSKRQNSTKPEQMDVDEQITSEDENAAKYQTFNFDESSNNNSSPHPRLPGVEGFFSINKTVHSDSSSEEDVPEVTSPKKKKKLTVAERTELIRQTEEKIRAKEIELADANVEPQSEEQFERLVTGNPNSSRLWAKYIAFCISNAEIQKARNIAKAALKRIELNEMEERYNIWITLLNLENSYGDNESFTGVFEEAVRCNDDLEIYLDVINLLADSEKYTEMNEKIKKVKNKHKKDPKMWINIARVYYKCGHLQDARNIHNSALKAIETKTNHVDVVVQFAIMEFNYGAKHHAEALFETVLQSNPKRVDVWSAYVDQMIKKDNIDGARRILERAVSQSIPPKKMKTLFKKFKEMELKHGNEEGVQHVIDLAQQYLGSEVK